MNESVNLLNIDEDLERLMEVDVSVKEQVQREQKDYRRKICKLCFLVFLLLFLSVLEFKNITHLSDRVMKVFYVVTQTRPSDGNLMPLGFSNNQPLLLPDIKIDQNMLKEPLQQVFPVSYSNSKENKSNSSQQEK
ncbi:MAG: hypothetical protein ACD_79C01082G0005 [uncultured bacterium]|nr:MAG: hypothetical protein ACD_79C01082G0005 [uncultured bacterium]